MYIFLGKIVNRYNRNVVRCANELSKTFTSRHERVWRWRNNMALHDDTVPINLHRCINHVDVCLCPDWLTESTAFTGLILFV